MSYSRDVIWAGTQLTHPEVTRSRDHSGTTQENSKRWEKSKRTSSNETRASFWNTEETRMTGTRIHTQRKMRQSIRWTRGTWDRITYTRKIRDQFRETWYPTPKQDTHQDSRKSSCVSPYHPWYARKNTSRNKSDWKISKESIYHKLSSCYQPLASTTELGNLDSPILSRHLHLLGRRWRRRHFSIYFPYSSKKRKQKPSYSECPIILMELCLNMGDA